MHHFRAVSPKWVLRPQKEISCHIFKMAILTKFFDNLMNHITREYAGKKIKLFLNVSPLTIVHLLLWPFKVASLYLVFARFRDDFCSAPKKSVYNWINSRQSHNFSKAIRQLFHNALISVELMALSKYVQWTLVIVNAWIVNNLSLVNIFGETGRLFYNINYMLNSKHLSLVNKIGDKTEFTITRVHCNNILC